MTSVRRKWTVGFGRDKLGRASNTETRTRAHSSEAARGQLRTHVSQGAFSVGAGAGRLELVGGGGGGGGNSKGGNAESFEKTVHGEIAGNHEGLKTRKRERRASSACNR